jgi:hypothetical protein
MNILSTLSPVQIGAWAVMLYLVVKAGAHWLEARGFVKRLRPVERRLNQVALFAAEHGAPRRALHEARLAVDETPLATMFEQTIRLQHAAGIRDQVEEAVQATLGPLHAAATHNELAGPRFGLAMTALGILVRFAGVSGAGVPVDELSGVGLALVSTALGITAAIIEARVIAHYLIPLEDRLAALGMRILLRTAHAPEAREHRPEVVHVA